MTLRRWDADPTLDFPRPIRIRNRKYRDEAELDAFDERQRMAAPGRLPDASSPDLLLTDIERLVGLLGDAIDQLESRRR